MANLFSEACAKIVQFCARKLSRLGKTQQKLFTKKELSRLSETQQNFCIMIIL